MFSVIRSHLRLSLLATVVAVGAVLWLVNGWVVHRFLPPFLHKQLTIALEREIEFADVDTNWFSYFKVKGVSIAKSANPKDGKLLTAGELVLRYHIVQLLSHIATKNPLAGIRRVELIEPSVEISLEQIRSAMEPSPKRELTKTRTGAPTGLPPLPKTYVGIKSGTFVLTRRGVPVLEIRRLKAELDLRDLPRIGGSLNFTIAPDSVISADGSCHLGLKNFKGEIALEHLDLGQLSDLARMLDPGMAIRVGGLLDAKLEVEGGFMTMDELLDQTFGKGTLRLARGSLALRGNPLITDAETSGFLEERQIVLETLTARLLSGALSANGSLGNLGQGRLRLKGKLEQVPVRALRALSPGLPPTLDGVFTFEFSATGTGRAPVFAGRISSPAIWLPGIRMENLVAEMVYTIRALELTNLKANLWEGGLHGEGALRGLDGAAPAIKLNLQGAGFNVARTPLGDSYAGTAELDANLEGPLDRLVGTLAARLRQVRARGLAIGDLTASAKFEGVKVRIEARTNKGTVSVGGTLVLSPALALEDCRAQVQERIPVLIALAGVEPPPGLDGRVSGTIRAEGPIADPVVTVAAVGSAVRFGRIVIGDVIRVPKFVFRRNTMEVPLETPAELEWSSERTVVMMSGAVPVGALSGTGKEELRFHLACTGGRMELLKRLDLVKEASGSFDLALDLAGTASQPTWKMLRLTSSGKRLVLKDPVFEKDFDGWSVNVVMENDEGAVKDTWLSLDRQQQSFSGRFGMHGWLPEEMDIETATVAAKAKYLRGLPFALEDFAEIRVRLNAHLIKRPGEKEIMLTGRDAEKGAELILSSGVIRYAGPPMGEAAPAAGAPTKSPATAPSGALVPPAKGPAPAPSLFDQFYANLSFIGTVSIGSNVEFAPRTVVGKASQSFFKLLTGDRAAFKKLLRQYTTKAGWKEFSRDALLTFDLKIKDGSHLKVSKMGEVLRAEGELALEPGGRVTLGPPGASVDFTIVGDPGLRQRIEFPVSETMTANLDLVAETVLYDKYLLTDSGDSAIVDELKVRLYVTPPRPDEPRKDSFLQFNFDLRSEPETVVGEVGGGATPAPGETATPARLVTVKPDKGALMMALFGLDALTAVGAGQSGAGGTGTGAGDTLKQSGAMAIVNAVLGPIRRLLGLDVLSVRKSEVAARRQRQSSAGPGGSGTPGASTSVLDNTELTAGVALTRNVFLNQRVVLLDSTQSTVQSSSMAQTRSNTTGFITELEFRRASYKLTTRGRWFGLPDDPKLDKPYELYGGAEVSHGFAGVSNREPFLW